MRFKLNVLVCALVAAIFLLPPVSVMSNDDVSVETTKTNDFNDFLEPIEETEIENNEIIEDDIKEKVSASSKRGLALEVTKLNADPDPEGEDVIDGTLVELEAYVQNHGSDPEEDRANNVEVQFFMDDDYIGNDTAQDANDNYYIDGGDTGYSYASWIAQEGTHVLKAVADPQGRTGGPTSLTISVTILKKDYDVDVTCGWPTASGEPGDDVRFYVTVRNNGLKSDTFDLGVTDKKDPGWAKKNTLGDEYFRKESDDSWVDELTLDSGEVEILYLDVEIPLTVRRTGTTGAPNEEDYIDVIVESQDGNSDEESILLRTTVINKREGTGANPPILVIDDDESNSEPNGENVYWANSAPSWYPVLDKVFERDIKAAGKTDGNNYIYKKQTNPPTSISEWNKYDLVIWDFGYDWMGDPVQSQRTLAKQYLNNGGNIFMSHENCWYGNVDPGAGYVTVDLFKNYFHIWHVSTGVGLPRPLVGVAGDEVGGGLSIDEINGATFTRIYDWAPGLQLDPREPGKSAGVFYAKAASADPYVAVRYNDTDLEDEETDFRTMYMGFSLYDIGDFYGDRDFKDAADVALRAEFVERAVTWFGVAPMLPDKFDLRTVITDPYGEFVEPGDNSFNDMNLTINNDGLAYSQDIKLYVNITDKSGGTEKFVIDEDNNGNSIEIASRESITISVTDWEPENTHEYTITAESTVSGETYHDNDKDTHDVEAKKYEDIECRAFWYSVEQPYFLAGIENVPVICDAVVENKGSKMETFDLKFTVYDPYLKINNVDEGDIDKDDDDIYDFSRGVTLKAGYSKHLRFVWTPKMAAGIVDGYTPAYGQAWEYPYQVSISSHLTADEDNDNDYTFAELIGGASSNHLGLPIAKYGAVFDEEGWLWTSGDWSTYDLGGNSDEYNEWHVTYTAATSGPNSFHAGDDRSTTDQSEFHYDQNLDVWGYSPAIDMTDVVEATWRNTWHGGLASGDYAYVGYIKDLPDDLSEIDDAETQQNQNTGNYMSGWWLFGSTMSYPIDDGTDVTDTHLYYRMVTNGNTQAAGTYPGWWYDETILHARYESYRSMDVSVQDIYTSPTIGEEDEDRVITAVIRNSGTDDITTDITDTVPLNVTCTVMNLTSLEYETGFSPDDEDAMQTIDQINRGELVSLTWDWTPEFIGDYEIEIAIDFARDGNPDNNISTAPGIVRYVYLSESFEGDPDEIAFSHSTEDSDGDGVDEAIDEWELGTPTGILVNTRWGPKSAHSGEKCFGTDMDDYYGEYIEDEDYYLGYGKDSAILSTELDLTTAADAKLLFSNWLEVEDSGNNDNIYDKAFVEASIDGGETWDELWRNPVAQDDDDQIYSTFGWKQETIPLDDYAGKKNVIIRWRFLCDYSVSYAGWYIDDVAVSGRAPLENDAGVETIDSPAPGVHLPLGRTAKVTATVMNFGKNDLINCKVNLKITKTLSGEEIETQEKFVGTVENPIKTGEKAQISFDWPVSDLFNDVDYDLMVSTYLTDGSGVYVDGYSLNDGKTITVKAKKDFDIEVQSISVFPRLSDRGSPRTITASIVNYGNQAERFNITLEGKWRQKSDDDWTIIEPNPYHGMIQLEAGEVLENWNTTFIPEVYAEYELSVIADTKLISYDYKSGLDPSDDDAWVIVDEDESDDNNIQTVSIRIPKVLWEDDMEWGSEQLSEEDWDHKSVRLGGSDAWHIEIGGYHNSNASWRCGNGMWTDPYTERLYPNRMNAVLVSPQIPLLTENVTGGLGVSFWMKYYIEPMDSRGKYLDSLYLEYLPVNGNPDLNDDWEAIYIKGYDHSPYNSAFGDPRLFWPNDKGPDTSDSSEYPGNEHGWIYNQIILDDAEMYVDKDGNPIDISQWKWDGFQFRFRFQTDSNVAYTGPWIDNVGVFGVVEASEPPIAKFEASWSDISGKQHNSYSMNIVDSLDYLTELDNVMPRDAGIPYDNNEYNKVTFDGRKSADPWDGQRGLRFNWDFNDLVDSDKDGIYTNDADATTSTIEWPFTKFGTFTITLTVTDSDGMIDIDTMKVVCGDKPIYDVVIKVEDIFETEDSVSSVSDKTKYGAGDTWNIWQGDKIVFSGAGAKDPEGKSSSEFLYRWAVLKEGSEINWDNIEWITPKRGQSDQEITFEKSGNYNVILEVDDAYNQDRYESGSKPENTGYAEIALYSWLDSINITVLPYSKLAKTVFISDMENNVVEVRYDIAYQATTLITDDTLGVVSVNKTNEPEDSETNRQIKTFIDFKTTNMYDQEGKKGFVWAKIIVIYPKQNLPKQLQFEEANPNRKHDVVQLYFWDKVFNAWVECEDTQKAADNDIRDLTAVECNVTHFTVIAPLINDKIQDFFRDPSIDSQDISLSVDAILGRGDKDREVKITAKIRNLGLLPVEEVDVKFKDGDVVIGEAKVLNIPGYGNKDVTITWTIKKDIDVGTHTIKVEIDPNNKLVDNEDSNDIDRKKIIVVEAVLVTPSFATSMISVFAAVIVVVGLSTKLRRKKKD